MIARLSELEQAIRDRIGERRTLHEFRGKPADWNRLCSALDVIGDSEFALASYLAHQPVTDQGVMYLHVYGALQLLQAQQDAARAVCESLGIRPRARPQIPHIRIARNRAIGHATRQSDDGDRLACFIVRATLSQHSFTLHTVSDNNWYLSEQRVDLPDLIAQQRAALTATLTEVVSFLDGVEMQHREKHRDVKLASAFPSTLGYYISKIFEGIHEAEKGALARGHIGFVADGMRELRALLEERGEWDANRSVRDQCELVTYPLEQLEAFFADRQASKMNDKDAYIFATFVSDQMQRLQAMAAELDQEYEDLPTEEPSVK